MNSNSQHFTCKTVLISCDWVITYKSIVFFWKDLVTIQYTACVNNGLFGCLKKSQRIGKLRKRGIFVIYIYPGPTSFLSLSPTFFGPHTLYFSSLLNLSLLSIFTSFTFQFFTFTKTRMFLFELWGCSCEAKTMGRLES